MGEAGAEAALALVGARFRLHGRDPGQGLDCVGVAMHAARADGHRGLVPSGYGLRGGDPGVVIAMLDRGLRRVASGGAGDLLLFAAGPGQLHLAVRVAGGMVHADAGLRRVVMRPGAAPWPLLGAWRV